MRFLIGEFTHESNCFATVRTDRARFEELNLLVGEEVLVEHRSRTSVVGGFINVLEARKHAVVGSISASAFPSGPVDGEFYRWVRSILLDDAAKESWDGILLSLHGAMFVEEAAGFPDPEGDLVAAIRAVVGPDLPIAVVLDPHSDTTDLLLSAASFTLAYNEEPHRDGHERGLEAAELLLRMKEDGLKPVSARRKAPMLLPAINMATDEGPMHDLHELRAELEKLPDVIDISIHGGFYGSDQEQAGFGIVCTTDGDMALAERLADQVAQAAWRKRHEFIVELTEPDAAVALAKSAGEPIGLVDEADDPAGGGSCDSVLILKAMIEGGITHGGVSTICDPEAVAACVAAGAGSTLTIAIGGKADDLHGPSLTVTGTVRRFHEGPMAIDQWSGKTFDAGMISVLDVGGILVVLTERKMVTENIDIFKNLGFDVRDMQAIVFKGLGLHIRQALEERVRRFLPINGVGVTHPDVTQLGPYRHLSRPIWPFDVDVDFR
ncbi:microcystin degradation protein MlrC [Rhizobium sp. BK313]|uniref:M81 family metallopeptidase n=1 Tax=Rhizobium sp. BK313 TaxID=2587081 RepID=UPI001061EB91|nr:M81 family metallopeptidase [Rhizobium sp. BK313]MBB3458013.1 microcystin degradation protein MlrC [Rhizobium sp. BK313]